MPLPVAGAPSRVKQDPAANKMTRVTPVSNRRASYRHNHGNFSQSRAEGCDKRVESFAAVLG